MWKIAADIHAEIITLVWFFAVACVLSGCTCSLMRRLAYFVPSLPNKDILVWSSHLIVFVDFLSVKCVILAIVFLALLLIYSAITFFRESHLFCRPLIVFSVPYLHIQKHQLYSQKLQMTSSVPDVNLFPSPFINGFCALLPAFCSFFFVNCISWLR